MENLSAIASWSGGKDSCLAYYRAIKKGYEIKSLLSFISRESKRGCFHGIVGDLIRLQAESLGVPLVLEEVSPDMQKYEEEFKAAVGKFKPQGIGSMVFGDIYLLDHQSWVDRVCSEIGIKPVEPLWNESTDGLLNEFIDLGFKTVIVSCKADVLGEEFIGKIIDKDMIGEFKKRNVCPCGENGEYHTLVIDGPIFKNRINILDSQPILRDGFWKHWFLDIKKYESVKK